MNIVETNLEFNPGLVVRKATNKVVIHHSVSPDVSARTVHRWHLSLGKAGIGYHYLIRANGSIERGRSEEYTGEHASLERNDDSLGICLTGNFSIYPHTETQLIALTELIKHIQARYGELEVVRHRDVDANPCPGELFPWDDLKRRIG